MSRYRIMTCIEFVGCPPSLDHFDQSDALPEALYHDLFCVVPTYGSLDNPTGPCKLCGIRDVVLAVLAIRCLCSRHR